MHVRIGLVTERCVGAGIARVEQGDGAAIGPQHQACGLDVPDTAMVTQTTPCNHVPVHELVLVQGDAHAEQVAEKARVDLDGVPASDQGRQG